ncbi:TetR family transcriptional regulator [Nocardia sp. NPDC004278]
MALPTVDATASPGVLPETIKSITQAVLDELAEHGHGRLSMAAVAKRAGVGKSALSRR